MNELVSVVVPVYKVEKYLDKCVESICAQTYRNLEIILIDDGSPDNCGKMCDSWADRDSRVRAIHKPNSGLSGARNKGIESAAGDYIMFIDSDDYIAGDMVRRLLDALQAADAQMSICNILRVAEDGEPIAELNTCPPIRDEVISGQDALEKSFEFRGFVYRVAWNKLYKRELFSEIRYPEGKYHEDEFVALMLFEKVETIACVSAVGYYYVQRPGSIMNSVNPGKALDGIHRDLLRARAAYEHGFLEHASLSYFKAARGISYQAANTTDDREIRQRTAQLKAEIRQSRYLHGGAPAKQKALLWLVLNCPGIYHFLRKKKQDYFSDTDT